MVWLAHYSVLTILSIPGRPATGPMEKEAASAGFYEPEHFNRKKFPRLQILTVAELLAGKEVQYPRVAPAATFKVAEPKTKQKDTRTRLL